MLSKQRVKAQGMNIGGEYHFPFGSVKMVQAQNTSSMVVDGLPINMGEPAGIVTFDDMRIYYAGDTGEFGDMALFSDGGLKQLLRPRND